MFTGIIEAVGAVRAIERRGGDIQLTIATGKLDMTDVQLGDSIAANGVCLTVIDFGSDYYRADLSAETLKRTTFGLRGNGDKLNLEKAMLPTTRMGGHLVSGHVDGIGEVIERNPVGRAIEYWLRAPSGLAKYIAEKGSICVDGISLTVNEVQGERFKLTIVPHTAAETTIVDYQAGTKVNLEVDVIARYLERLLTAEPDQPESQGLTWARLAELGFGKS